MLDDLELAFDDFTLLSQGLLVELRDESLLRFIERRGSTYLCWCGSTNLLQDRLGRLILLLTEEHQRVWLARSRLRDNLLRLGWSGFKGHRRLAVLVDRCGRRFLLCNNILLRSLLWRVDLKHFLELLPLDFLSLLQVGRYSLRLLWFNLLL